MIYVCFEESYSLYFNGKVYEYNLNESKKSDGVDVA